MRVLRYPSLVSLACAVLLSTVLNAPAAAYQDQVQRFGALITRNVPYATVDGLPLYLDVWRSFDSSTSDSGNGLKRYVVGDMLPVAVYIHGGGWRGGDKGDHPDLLQPVVEAGYLVFSINYRLSQQARFPAQLSDCKAAIRWIRKHAAEYGGDGERIGVFGTPAGGHLCALLGATNGVAALEGTVGETGASSSVQAVCDWSGPVNLQKFQDAPRNARSMIEQLLGDTAEQRPDLAAAASPVQWIDAGDPPFLIIHGKNDPLIPYGQSVELEQRLREAGVPAELIVIPQGKHGRFWKTDPNQEELLARMIAFFDEYVRR